MYLPACYWVLKYIKTKNITAIFFLGLACGLGILTKGTSYLYLAPILGVFGISVLFNAIKSKKYQPVLYSILLVVLVPVIINSGQYYRNYCYNQNILGVDKDESKLYSNEKMSPKLFISNAAKNVGLQIGFIASPKTALIGDKIILKIHSLLHVDVNDPAISFPMVQGIGNILYTSPLIANHEDIAPNMIHFIVIGITFIIIFFYLITKRDIPLYVKLITLIVFLQAFLFVFFFKWQPWGTRLQMLMFLLSVPLICWVTKENKLFKKAIPYVIVPLVIAYTCLIIVLNYTRPLINVPGLTSKVSMSAPRFKKYFTMTAFRPSAYSEYTGILNEMDKHHFKKIGLILDVYDWEYPLFYNCYVKQIDPVDIDVQNSSRNIMPKPQDIDCIVTTHVNKPFINYNGQQYYNKSDSNSVIFLYERAVN